MPNAAIYVRVSTLRQAERDLSLPDQIAQCRAHCERLGWDVAHIYNEPGASALDDERPVFQEMIYKATRPERPFDFVVVHSLSSFSRDALHSELYVRKLRKAGVELVSITQAVSADPSGEMVRKLLNVFDEHQSRENAKHVHRAMCENARQGFWNGSAPPFGYDAVVTERRGSRDKKALVVNEDEARLVRRVFALASGEAGRAMGVKAIALWLNERGHARRGRRFSTGGVDDILTNTAYIGRHLFNRFDSRNRRPRPPSEWVAFDAPALVAEADFNLVQGLLQARAPKRTPPRVVNGPTFLAGLARCGYCGAALIQNTGKGGRDRSCCCSAKLKVGPTACRGLRMPMDRLDGLVVGELARRVLDPQRLPALLDAYVRASADRDGAARSRLSSLRADHKETEAGLLRLPELVEKGLFDADDPALREKMTGLKLRRDELARQIADAQRGLAGGAPAVTPDKIARLAVLLRDRLRDGSPELRQAYARLVLCEVRVTDEAIRIAGSKSVLAQAAAADADIPPPEVLSFVRKWRAQGESNPCFRRERATSWTARRWARAPARGSRGAREL